MRPFAPTPTRLAASAAAIALLALAAPWPSLAHSSPDATGNGTSTAPSPLNPATPSMPMQHHALPASGQVENDNTAWADANAAVGQFPRGHGDVLRWEAEQAKAAAASPPAPAEAMPANCPMGMQMDSPAHQAMQQRMTPEMRQQMQQQMLQKMSPEMRQTMQQRMGQPMQHGSGHSSHGGKP